MIQWYLVLDLWTLCATVCHPGHSGAFEPPFMPKLDSTLPGETFLPASDTANVKDIFMPSGLEVILSQHFLHHHSLSISLFLLPPFSTSRIFHTSYAGSCIFILPFAPKRGEAKCPAMTAETGGLSSPHGTDGLLKRTN